MRLFKYLSFILLIIISSFAEKTSQKVIPKKIITKITVQGNKRVSKTKVLSMIKTKPYDLFDELEIYNDIKLLFATGEFSKIDVEEKKRKNGIELIFKLVENPIVVNIEFKGNKDIDKDELLKEISLKEGEPFTDKRLHESINKIGNFYKEKGFYNIKVNIKKKLKKNNTIKIIFLINEGKKVYVKKIIIKGLKKFSEGTIIGEMETKERGFLRSGIFKEEEFYNDLKRIINFCKNKGHAKAKIKKHRINIDKKEGSVVIEITMDEGKLYNIGDVKLSLKELEPDLIKTFKNKMRIRKGRTFNAEELKKDEIMIQNYYSDNGSIYARVGDDLTFDDEKNLVNVEIKVIEGEVAYIEDIIIKGLFKTKEKVVRRELLVKPGEKFDRKKVMRSIERIYNLGFFDDVRPDITQSSRPGYQNIIINLIEKKQTGQLNLGAGYSVIDGFTGTFGITENNFRGNGQRIGGNIEYGGFRRLFELSFFDPWFNDTTTSVGFSVFYSQRDYFSDYKEVKYGTSIKLAKPISEYWKGWFTYTYNVTKIFDVDSSASNEIKKEEGERTVSGVTLELVYDNRDSIFFDTRRGMRHSFSFEVTGLGGNLFYTRYILDNRFYLETFPRWVIAFNVRVGYVTGYGRTPGVPFFERFFLGGTDDIRGYPERGVGPMDSTGFPIGGRFMSLAHLEYRMPLPIGGERPSFYFVLFVDAGGNWDKTELAGFDDVATSAGFGIRAVIPGTVLVIRLDYAFGFNPKYTTPGGRPHFSFGSIF